MTWRNTHSRKCDVNVSRVWKAYLDAGPAILLEKDVFRLEITVEHLLGAQEAQAHQHLVCKLPATNSQHIE